MQDKSSLAFTHQRPRTQKRGESHWSYSHTVGTATNSLYNSPECLTPTVYPLHSCSASFNGIAFNDPKMSLFVIIPSPLCCYKPI